MVVVAQLVRVSVCGTECRGFESRLPPIVLKDLLCGSFFFDKTPSLFSMKSVNSQKKRIFAF